MAIEEKEQKETILDELIEKVEKDPLPTNIFTTEDTDPLVLLGKLNEVIAHLKALRLLIGESDSKATEALTKAIESLTIAQEAITTATTLGNEAKAIAQNALEQANSAHDTAGEALMEATDAKADAQQATTLGNEAKALAQQAITTANEALSQVVQGLGTKVYDNHGNLLAGAKFTGHNGINVDMDETDPETFNIRLDNELVGQLEMTDGLIEAIENEINNSIKPRLTSVESTASANASDLEGVHTDLNNLDNRTTSLENNKADKINSEQEITAKTITAQTGNFTNINNSFSAFNSLIGSLLHSATLLGTRAGTGVINLRAPITNYRIIVVCSDNRDDGNGFITSQQCLPVGYITSWYGKELASHGRDNVSFTIKFNNANQAQITQEYYARKIRVFGVV